jgi:hypothetical protein
VQVVTLIVLATQEAEIKRLTVQSQPGQTVQQETLPQKYPAQEKGWPSGSSGSLPAYQARGSQFKHQYHKK